MSLSEKLEEAVRLLHDKQADWGDFYAAAINLLSDHADDLRQALRDSERLQAALVVGLSEGIYGPHTLEVDGLTAAQEVELNGQRVRLVIEDAAMGRREGRGDGG